MKKQIKTLLSLCLFLVAIVSCKAPENVVYLQDLDPSKPEEIQAVRYLSIKPGDKLQVHVHSRDEKISSLFNVRVGGSAGIGSMGSGMNTTIDLYAYTVDADGYIDFPVIGKVHVAGLSRQQAANYIKDILVSENLVKDPYVACSFTTAIFYVLGEINGRGSYPLAKDAITILEAIATAGDLPLSADRTNIQVLREVNGQLHTFEVDITQAKSVLSSPVYYIQPDDIIYVKPTKKTQYETTALGNAVRTPNFWLGLTGTLLSLGLTIYNLIK